MDREGTEVHSRKNQKIIVRETKDKSEMEQNNIFDAVYNEEKGKILARIRAKMVEQYGEEDGHVAIVDDMIAKTKEYASPDYVGSSKEHMYRLLVKRGLAQRVQGKNIYDVIEDRYNAVPKDGSKETNKSKYLWK
jgi:hypothetical protein